MNRALDTLAVVVMALMWSGVGYGPNTWQWWVSIVCMVVSSGCGYYRGRKEGAA